MNGPDTSAFIALFKEACTKCFGRLPDHPLSETEAKHLSEKKFDQTGLVIGAKSIKNYSLYVFNGAAGKEENPSVATLDTLARYVLNAPYTGEVQRKEKESHYPYWFRYKEQFLRSWKNTAPQKRRSFTLNFLPAIMLVAVLLFIFWPFSGSKNTLFADNFTSVSEDSLKSRGWFVQSKDTAWWNRRDRQPEHLTLFTLKGDNWPDTLAGPGIRNLLLRKIEAECFTVELHLSDFVPTQNWQQAGILLLEDR